MGTAGIDGDLGWDQYRNRRHQNEGSRIDYVMVAGRSQWGIKGIWQRPLDVWETFEDWSTNGIVNPCQSIVYSEIVVVVFAMKSHEVSSIFPTGFTRKGHMRTNLQHCCFCDRPLEGLESLYFQTQICSKMGWVDFSYFFYGQVSPISQYEATTEVSGS
jgi:hypothetical protein